MPSSQRINTFELWCWRRLLRVPWTARKSNQSILKEISPEYALEGLMLKLELQYFGHLIRRTDSLEKTLMLGKIEGGRRRGRQSPGPLTGENASILSLVSRDSPLNCWRWAFEICRCSPRHFASFLPSPLRPWPFPIAGSSSAAAWCSLPGLERIISWKAGGGGQTSKGAQFSGENGD